MPSPADREKALETALAQIDRQFGKGSVMRLGSEDRAPVEVIPTGSIALDVALGVGGLPRGRIIEIYGPESSGKTTLTLHAIANAQRAGGIAAFVDAEHALDPDYAKKLGVDIDSLLVSQPDTGEQALEIADMLVRSGSIDLIVIDSVAALVPRAEIEGEMGDSHVGLQARLMSQALRKLTGGLNQTNTTMIFINQLREKIGVFFGSPETTAGGKALKFYASVRLDIRRIETLKDGTDAVGNRTRVKVVKNKMAPPFKQAEFDILYGVGISREGSLIDYGVDQGIVKKSGAWYTYDGDQLGQGKENARNFLLQNPDIAADIEKKILVKLGIGAAGAAQRPLRRTSSRSRASSGARAPEPPQERDREGVEMSDASEHLAPVSYLPWARPEAPVADEPVGADPGAQSEAAEPVEGTDSTRPDRVEHGAQRADRGGQRDWNGGQRRAERRRSRFAIVADDPDETGPERDERIDRLVVSRLRRSALSVAEVRAVLAEHGLDEAEIEEWIERYERFGYLDDARLAEQLVHVNGARRGRGSGAILQELARRGVDATAARTAVRRTRPRGRAPQRPRRRRTPRPPALRARPADGRATTLRVPPAARISRRRRPRGGDGGVVRRWLVNWCDHEHPSRGLDGRGH